MHTNKKKFELCSLHKWQPTEIKSSPQKAHLPESVRHQMDVTVEILGGHGCLNDQQNDAT